MIDLSEETINGKLIHDYKVWWRTPLGLHKQLDAARIVAEDIGMPIYMIRAVPVALSEDGYYEEILGG